jgi:hypothetical protein
MLEETIAIEWIHRSGWEGIEYTTQSRGMLLIGCVYLPIKWVIVGHDDGLAGFRKGELNIEKDQRTSRRCSKKRVEESQKRFVTKRADQVDEEDVE